VADFQASGWACGSYLNVGCMWLWDAQDYISFDVGGRVEPFGRFCDESQFEGLANALAERAANEVVRYRRQFLSVRDVSAYYLSTPPDGVWSTFHAAVACALTARAEEATRLFRQLQIRMMIDVTGFSGQKPIPCTSPRFSTTRSAFAIPWSIGSSSRGNCRTSQP
jgi:hypothetical protein